MRLEDRIDRRRNGRTHRRIVNDLAVLNPTAHLSEPIGRGQTLERLLDHFDPVFDGNIPPHGYVHGPKGAGKSAVVTALFEQLSRAGPSPRGAIHTTTRTSGRPTTSFCYVDARAASTPFGLLHDTLDSLTELDVPSQGIGVEDLRERLTEALSYDHHAVVAVDHVAEADTYPAHEAIDMLASVTPHLSVLAVGRDPPSVVDSSVETIAVPAYDRHTLVDILVERASDGIARSALAHESTTEIASWAEGDAHDALSALYGAATLAADDDAELIDASHVAAGIDAVPEDSCSLGRVLALPETRQRVLREFVRFTEDERESVTAATAALAHAPSVDLSTATIKRVLYELSDIGVVRRVADEDSVDGPGRPATRPVPNFPTLVFRHLFDADR
ncbi:Cdc6/Cdc18 family protein [Haloferax namakaokahaiae]|uniref:Cdc6/Cdc18 family protein n=1 Tax=Haloferax namakaokahaiae TaxID=1748331 RepID=A0ABD5ZF54_9EURY